MTFPGNAVFLSYASQDAQAAQNLCNALRAAGIEVWFDQSELRGGDAWDQKIRRRIQDCALFVPIISAQTQARPEGYFRLEWKLAVDRSHLMAAEKAFLVPVVIDATTEPEALVPAQFREVQWIRTQAAEVQTAFVDRIAVLLNQPVVHHVRSTERGVTGAPTRRLPIASMAVSVAVLVALVIATAMRGGWLWHQPGPKVGASITSAPAAPTPPATSEKSVAVLPFVDMSEKKDQEYFSDGLAEELIDHLAHADDLKVIARTSSFQFKGKNEDVRTIGKRLGVAYLLEGSVRRSANTMRITAQLINAIDGTYRWSETYDRKVDDIFRIQDEIAAAVVTALKATMTAREKGRGQSSNIEAYNEILRGRYFRERNTEEDSGRSVEALRRAITIDPDNATAWAELGYTYHRRGVYGWRPPKEAYAESRNAIDRALVLNPNEAKAHYVLGLILGGYLHEVETSKMQIRQAFELDPKLAADSLNDAIDAYADGQLEVALTEFLRHAELNPLDPYTLSWLAGSLIDANRLPEAERVGRNILDINPMFAGAHCLLGYVFLDERRFDEALAMMTQEPGENSRMACVADALWAMGRHAEAEISIAQVEAKYATSEAYGIAGHYARRGDADNTFKWLSRAYDNQEPPIQLLKGDSVFRAFRRDPRFAALLGKLNRS